MKKQPRHPVQPLIFDDRNVIRFKRNKIVEYLLDSGPFDMNHLAMQDFSDEDREQFAQLIGYSWSGACDLSYVSRAALDSSMAEFRKRTGFVCGDDSE